jgi:S-adenosylmethionine-diacylglycerol 3-amino-3-carboxypropyl transferase
MQITASMTMQTPSSTGERLRRAVSPSAIWTRTGLLEHLFAWAFKGLVYPQIWEDPEVDIEALALTPDSHVVAIASGGCNVLSYLIGDPRRITAVDLSPAHVALGKLKIAAAQRLPSWRAFHDFFGKADSEANVAAFARHIAPHLDAQSAGYWKARRYGGLGRQRIAAFADNFYRGGLLGHCIGLAHLVARAYGVNPRDVLRARTLDEQRTFFNTSLAPLFDKRFVRWATGQRVSLYGLGIPPAQYEVLVAQDGMASALRERVERLACGFPLTENYFAWQAFGRGYAEGGPLPPYLREAHFETVRARAGRIEVLNRSFTEYLETCDDASRDRYILLDAQDWMNDAQLNALWREITRTARPGARVIFRTAARPSLLPGRVAPEILDRWRYDEAASAASTARDRSAIYGGFHLYVLEG